MSNLAHAFDTLHYAKRLKAVGVEEREAEVHAETIAEAINILMDDTIATKPDIKYLELQIKNLEESTKIEIKNLEASTKVAIKTLEESTKIAIKNSEERIMYRITTRLGAMLVGGFAISGVIFGMIIKFL